MLTSLKLTSVSCRLAILLLCALYSASMQGATVQFHAWGGSAQVNGYLEWVSEQVEARYGIEVNHVKLADTSDAVSRVLAEKAAGNLNQGSVDLIWINGENFAAMSEHGLLLKNWVSQLANFPLTLPEKNTAMVTDFGLPTQGQEAPWGKAAMVFYYNKRYVSSPPKTIHELLHFAQRYPNRFSYPLPNDYLGISFLKYALIALNPDNRDVFYQPVNDTVFRQRSEVLWRFLDKLHPLMWKGGRYMVSQASTLQRLMSDGELLLAFSFTASEIPSAVKRYDLPESVRTYAMSDGSLGNVHFIGIPFNSAHVEEAKTVVNFLLSPEAQAEKQKVAVWGDETVLDMAALNPMQQARFQSETLHPSALPIAGIYHLLPEPHASWTDKLREAWFARYGERF
ncbi:ABC transporter substrate-binding protein [Alteromonas sp. 14N.309.X.WAT.G.H12]